MKFSIDSIMFILISPELLFKPQRGRLLLIWFFRQSHYLIAGCIIRCVDFFVFTEADFNGFYYFIANNECNGIIIRKNDLSRRHILAGIPFKNGNGFIIFALINYYP